MPSILFVGEKDIIFHSAQTAERLGDLLPPCQGKYSSWGWTHAYKSD
jgi:hypothetical protein